MAFIDVIVQKRQEQKEALESMRDFHEEERKKTMKRLKEYNRV